MLHDVTVSIVDLSELFSGQHRYKLPWFQRAYAWQIGHVWRLLDSIIAAMGSRDAEQRLHLGTLTLAAKPGQPDIALVDGHQRMMTLTILFSVLRDLEDDEARRTWLDGYIADQAASTADGRNHRFVANPLLEAFCADFVQVPGATGAEYDGDELALSTSERNILDNRSKLRERLARMSGEDRRRIAGFLLKGCLLILHVWNDENAAWEALRTEEETRLEFNHADQARWSVLAVVPQAERRHAARIWDECESLLEPADVYALLGHLRLIQTRRRLRQTVEAEVCVNFHLDRDGLQFFGSRMLPAARSLSQLRTRDFGPTQARLEIAACVERLHWIERHSWVPGALYWLEVRGIDHAATPLFFRRLERLVWLLKIAGLDPSHQQGRIVRVLNDIDSVDAVDAMASLWIEAELEREALASLRTQNFCGKHYSNPVLRRIEAALAADPGPVHRNRVTVEHVLPRSPPRRSDWTRTFRTARDIATNVNRLGNMTFLTSAENQLADTADWNVKRPILARSAFAITRRAAAAEVWDAAHIKARTEELVAVLFQALGVGE